MNYPITIDHSVEIRVRYAETDKMGIVYNGEYLTYFEVSRVDMMRHIGLPYPELENNGYQLPLVESYVKYKSPAYFDDLLQVKAHLEFIPAPTMRIKYNIFRGNTIISTGYTVHSFFNSKLQKPVKPPRVFIDALINYVKRNGGKF